MTWPRRVLLPTYYGDELRQTPLLARNGELIELTRGRVLSRHVQDAVGVYVDSDLIPNTVVHSVCRRRSGFPASHHKFGHLSADISDMFVNHLLRLPIAELFTPDLEWLHDFLAQRVAWEYFGVDFTCFHGAACSLDVFVGQLSLAFRPQSPAVSNLVSIVFPGSFLHLLKDLLVCLRCRNVVDLKLLFSSTVVVYDTRSSSVPSSHLPHRGVLSYWFRSRREGASQPVSTLIGHFVLGSASFRAS